MWFLDFRTRDVGGPVATTPVLYQDGIRRGSGLGALPGHAGGLTFVVHGYNNDRAQGMASIAGFASAAAAAVPALAGTLLVGVLWPGDAIFGFLSYPTEERDADATAAAFARELARTRLDAIPTFVAHSLGCRVVLETIERLTRLHPDRAWVDQIVLMAGAVDNDCLGRRERYLRGATGALRVVTVASTADRVLQLAFPAGDWLTGIFSGGYTRTALGRSGPAAEPRPPQATSPFQVGAFGIGHGDYLGGDTPPRRQAARFAGRAIVREPLVWEP